jgi:hypothetical protein
MAGPLLDLARKVSGVMKPPCARVYQSGGVVNVVPASAYFSGPVVP